MVASTPRSIRVSNRRFIRLQPDMGVVPVVVKIQLPSLGTLASNSRASGGSGTICGRLFLVRAPGKFHVATSSLNSPRVMPATSRKRQPVSSSNFNNWLNGTPTESVAFQNATISALLNTRSRAASFAGGCTLAQGSHQYGGGGATN